MAGKYRTQIPRPPTRKRKPSVRPLPPRPKGEVERLAVRRLAAMRYRLAGATYSAIAEKLTEDRVREYADAHDISFERAMKKFPPVSTRTAWEDVTAELEELRRETEMQRADLMALENARLDQCSRRRCRCSRRATCRLADWLSRRWDGVAFSLPDRCRYASRSALLSPCAADRRRRACSQSPPHPLTKVRISSPSARRVSDQNGFAATWDTTSYGTHGGNAGLILQFVSEHLDRFVLEYLRVNEVACG